MTDEERNQVLKMIEEGRITAEEGLKLMQALEQNPAEAASGLEAAGQSGNARRDGQAGPGSDPKIAQLKSTVRTLWQVGLWAGLAVTLSSAAGMYALLRGPGTSFWFYCLTVPLLLGVALMAAAAGSRNARWLFVDIRGKRGEGPHHIFLGFPLPLKLTAWFLRTFGDKIPDLRNTKVDEVIEIVESGLSSDEPLVVNVDEGEDGERVQVYIG